MVKQITVPDPEQKECRYCDHKKTLSVFKAYCPVFDRMLEEKTINDPAFTLGVRNYIVRLPECINAVRQALGGG